MVYQIEVVLTNGSLSQFSFFFFSEQSKASILLNWTVVNEDVHR
jgi:hypothetical protein